MYYCIFHSSTDLGQPLVSVMSDGNLTAGETFSLECVVETVEGVRSEDISIVWMGPDGSEPSGDSIEIGDLTTEGTVTRGRLVFSPLHTSDRGQHSCTGRIVADSVGVDVSDTSTVEINVISKYCIYIHLHC